MDIALTKQQFQIILSALDKAALWEMSIADAWTPAAYLQTPEKKRNANAAFKAARIYTRLFKELKGKQK